MIMNRCFAIFFLVFNLFIFFFQLFSMAMRWFCVHVCFILLRFLLFDFLIVRAMHPTINFVFHSFSLFGVFFSLSFFLFSSVQTHAHLRFIFISVVLFFLIKFQFISTTCVHDRAQIYIFFLSFSHAHVDDLVCVHIQRRQNKTKTWIGKSWTRLKCVYHWHWVITVAYARRLLLPVHSFLHVLLRK